jgi:Flp pilus assembly pilin Flp
MALLCIGGRVVLWVQKWFGKFCKDESGQGITEYGAILAFVALLVAVAFGCTGGSLSGALSRAFAEVASQLNALSAAATSSSS